MSVFIRLTRSIDEAKILVNADHIVSMIETPDHRNAEIIISHLRMIREDENGESFIEVDEREDEIIAKLRLAGCKVIG